MKSVNRGATLVEFSLIFPVLILLVVFAVDGFLFAFRYSKLTYGVAELTRRVSVIVGIEMGEGESCMALTSRAATAGNALISSGGPLADLISSPPEYEVIGGVPYPFLSIIGRVASGCLFCRFLPAGLIETRSTLAIERQSTGCL